MNSNHPSWIIKQIPSAAILRINWLYSSKRIFEEPSSEALHKNVFNKKLEFLDPNKTNEYSHNNTQHTKYRINNTYNINNHLGNSNYQNKNRHTKMIWFNPPFGELTNIDIVKYLLNLIDKH